MKGIPTFRPKRLKQAVVLTGVTMLVAAASVLGTAQAHAATGVLGTDHGALVITNTAGQSSGSVNDNLKYSTTEACPTGFQGSGTLLLVDPNDNTNFDAPAPINNSVAAPFSGTVSLANLALELQIFPQMAGTTSEYVIKCTANASGQGASEYVMDTFVTIDASGSTYSFSATPPSGPPASVNLSLTANPNPATSGQSVTLTATASVSGATGTVTFQNNGTVIGSPVALSGGTASTPFTAPTVTTASTVNLTATYTPSGNFTAGTGGTLALPVNPAPANSGTIPLAVAVPQSGSFTLTVDSTDLVTLNATGLTATGATTPITVVDSRNSYPGWSVSGQDGAWTGTGTAAGGTFSGNQLGWTPTDTALAPGATLGSPVTAGSPGLGSAAPLASAPHGLGNGFGTTTLGANLSLAIPATAPAGPYTSGLTITAVTSN